MNSKSDFVKSYFGQGFLEFDKNLLTEFPDFHELINSAALEKVWMRPGRLSIAQKSLITIATQAALGRWEQVEIHMRGFLAQKGSPEELKEMLLQVAIYCGFPAALSGYMILKKLSAE